MIALFVFFGGYGLMCALPISIWVAIKEQKEGKSEYFEGRDLALFFPIIAGIFCYFLAYHFLSEDVKVDFLKLLNDFSLIDTNFSRIIDERAHTELCSEDYIVSTAECAFNRQKNVFLSFFVANFIATITFFWSVWLTSEALSWSDNIVRNRENILLPFVGVVCAVGLVFVPFAMWESTLLEGFMKSHINLPRWPFVVNFSFWFFAWIGWQFAISIGRAAFKNRI